MLMPFKITEKSISLAQKSQFHRKWNHRLSPYPSTFCQQTISTMKSRSLNVWYQYLVLLVKYRCSHSCLIIWLQRQQNYTKVCCPNAPPGWWGRLLRFWGSQNTTGEASTSTILNSSKWHWSLHPRSFVLFYFFNSFSSLWSLWWSITKSAGGETWY